MTAPNFRPDLKSLRLVRRWESLLATLAVAFLAACGANAIGAESGPAEVEMAVGDSVFMDEGRLEVTFQEVPFDNRCPRDVQCIVSGMAKATVVVQEQGGEENSLTLELDARGPQTVELGNYSFSLMAVEPYPVSTTNIEPEDYRVQLRCERRN